MLDQLSKRVTSNPARVEQFVAGNRVRLLNHGEVAYARMLAAIDGAQHCVWMEMYWFAADNIGQRFFTALKEASRRGVQVAVIYDDWGSFATPERAFDGLRSAGATVLSYNPMSPLKRRFRLAKLTQRNHRKVLIVDQKLAFTGGQNIGDEWCDSDTRPGWRDEVVEVEGPAVRGFADAFLDSWTSQADAGSAADAALPSLRLRRDTQLPWSLRSGVPVAVLTQSAFGRRSDAMRAYVHRLRSARKRVYIAHSYFVPTRTIVRCLVGAARRGAEVRIIVAGQSDVPVVRLAGMAVWGRLLRAGVRIYEWNASVLHSKLAVIDGDWVTAGSFNLDYISLRVNRELNVAIVDEAFGHRVELEFEQALSLCAEVDYATFRARSLGQRVLERAAYAFRAWM